MLTIPYNVDGTNYYKKILADIPLTELGKRDIKIWHSRLEKKPIAANRALAALSVAKDWDSQRLIPAYKETNPCLRIAKYTENKDKAYIEGLPKVLRLLNIVMSSYIEIHNFYASFYCCLKLEND